MYKFLQIYIWYIMCRSGGPIVMSFDLFAESNFSSGYVRLDPYKHIWTSYQFCMKHLDHALCHALFLVIATLKINITSLW